MTYTYTYKNKTTLPINNVKVIAKMPQLSDTLENTEFVSVTNPTTGEGSLCESTSATEVTCSLGTLQPEEIGTFRMAVKVPATASATAKVNNGTYTIEGVNAEKVLGPLVQTDVTDEVSSVSNLVVNVNGLPTNGTIGVSYQGTFTCTNTPTASATGDASGASCEIANLPAGLSLGSCTLSPGNSAWVEPAIIPINQTVTCSVTGIPTSAGTVSALASTNGANNSNSLSNKATATIAITSPSSSSSHLVVGVNNLPTTTTVGTSYDGTFTCSNVSTATATAAASNASCAISNLPTGLSLNGCTISPTNAVWSQPASIPVNQTVTCSVSGTSTTAAIFTALASTNASNNENTTTNRANVTIVVSSSTDLVIPATLNGSPVIDSSVICCGRPVILGDLPLPGNAPTTYVITNKTGNVTCKIGKTRTQTYLKMNGIGSCTIVGTKNNVISAPLKLIAG